MDVTSQLVNDFYKAYVKCWKTGRSKKVAMYPLTLSNQSWETPTGLIWPNKQSKDSISTLFRLLVNWADRPVENFLK